MITDNQTLKLMLIEMSSFFHSVCFCGCRHVYSGNHEAVGRNRTAVCTLTNTTFFYFSNGVSTDTKHVLLDFDSGLMRIKIHGTTTSKSCENTCRCVREATALCLAASHDKVKAELKFDDINVTDWSRFVAWSGICERPMVKRRPQAAAAAALPSAFRFTELLAAARPAAAGGFNYQQINAGWERWYENLRSSADRRVLSRSLLRGCNGRVLRPTCSALTFTYCRCRGEAS